MYRIYADTVKRRLQLGHKGENEARCVIFVLASYKEEYGEGTWEIVNQRKGDTVPYLVTNTYELDDKAVWTLTNVDTDVAGEGRCELRYKVDGVLMKTDVFATKILPSLGDTGETPSPSEDLIEKLSKIKEEATAAATAAKTCEDASAESEKAAAKSAESANASQKAAATSEANAASSATAAAKSAKSAFATCSTASATAAKVATITGNTNWTLTVGAIICVKYTYSNTASNCTLNVNDTGAKSFYWDIAVYTGKSTTICGVAKRYHYYMYDGTYWVFMGASSDYNTIPSNAALGNGYGTCTTAADTTAKVATLGSYSLVTGGKPTIKFSYDVPASATLNINSKGAKPIYYGGSAITADIIAAGDIVTFVYDGSYYHVIAIDKMSKVTQTVENSSTSVPSGAAVTKKLSSYLEFEVLSTIS